jgi:predicted KAP-like P-loop ATPase
LAEYTVVVPHDRREDQEQDNASYFADRPIAKAQDDLLNRVPFAAAVAKSLQSWRAKDSLVIGLEGPWGCGKSSIKNLVVEILGSTPDSVELVEFNPWRITNADQLTDAFFTEIGKTIGRGGKKVRSRAAAMWRQYAHLVSGGEGLVKGLSKLLPIALAALAAMGILSATQLLPTVSSAFSSIWFLVLVAALMLFRGTGKFAGWMAGWLVPQDQTTGTTLETTKAEVHRLLSGLEKPIVVVLDDIDRLSPDELHLVLKLVKANGDFPNITYLMLYDAQQVETALGSLGINAQAYMQKIVQVLHRVPTVDQDTIDRLLFSGLEQVLHEVGATLDEEDQQRLGNVYYDGIQTCFTTVREVYRHLSSFSFHCFLMTKDGVLEVNAVDLAALEAIRLSEPTIYNRLLTLKDLLTRDHDARQEEQVRETLQTLVDDAESRHAKAIRAMLRHLFPRVAWTQGMIKTGGGPLDEWLNRLLVCHPDVFARFFQLEVPSGDVLQADMVALMDQRRSAQQLSAKFRELKQRGLLETTMRRLDALKEDLPIDYAEDFLTALSDIADELSSERKPFGFDASLNVDRVAYWYLRRLPSDEARAAVLKRVLERTHGLSLPQSIVYSEQRGREEPSPHHANLVSDEDLGKLEAAYVRLVREKIARNPFSPISAPHLGSILLVWEKIAGVDEVRAWVNSLLELEGGPTRLLGAFVQTAYSAGLGDVVSRSRKYIQLEALERYVDLASLNSHLQMMEDSDLDADQKIAIEAYRQAKAERAESDQNGTSRRGS